MEEVMVIEIFWTADSDMVGYYLTCYCCQSKHKTRRPFLERRVLVCYMNEVVFVFCRPGSDLLFRVLRRSTIGAGVIYGRVRDGIGYGRPAKATRPAKDKNGLSSF